MKKFIRIMAIMAVFCIVLACLFTAVELSHDCIGDDCPICAAINVFRHISDAVFVLTVSPFAVNHLSSVLEIICGERKVQLHTLISMKVKLSN